MNLQLIKNKIISYLHLDNLFIAVLTIYVLLKLYCAYSMIILRFNM